MIYLCAVATKSDLFEVQIFKTIAEKLGYNVRIFGENKDWKGFISKIEYFCEGLEGINDDDLVVCSDCYDVIPLRKADEFEVESLKYLERDVKIIASAEMYCLFNCRQMKVWHEKSSLKINEGLKYVNAGLIFGKAKDLRKMWETFLQRRVEDDQIALSQYFDENYDSCFLDSFSDFFQTSASNKYVPRISSNLLSEESKNGEGTFFVHIPSLSNHLCQREYYRDVLAHVAKRLKLEHLVGPQVKTSISSIVEKYLFPFVLFALIFMVFLYYLKNKNV